MINAIQSVFTTSYKPSEKTAPPEKQFDAQNGKKLQFLTLQKKEWGVR